MLHVTQYIDYFQANKLAEAVTSRSYLCLHDNNMYEYPDNARHHKIFLTIVSRATMMSKTDMAEVEVRRLPPLPLPPYVEGSEVNASIHFETQMATQYKNQQSTLEGALLHNQDIEYHPAPFNHWILDVTQYDSSMSASPSVSGSETFSAPLDYPDTQPVYHILGQPLPLGPDDMMNTQPWSAGLDEVWHNHNDFQQSQMPLWTYQDEPSVHQPPHYLPMYQAKLEQERESRCRLTSQPLPLPPTLASCTGHTALDMTAASTFDSDCASDSGSSDSGDEVTFPAYNQRAQHRFSHHAKHKDSAVLKLGKWSMGSDSLHISEQRHFQCQFSKYPDAHGRWCVKSFVRPEHLRRHHKTVHGTEKNYVCKVPGCKRHFSRGDNLRDHYWTHVNRGGRAGKNTKMTLAELKVILGPKEKRLIRRLKQRLSKTKVEKFTVKSKL